MTVSYQYEVASSTSGGFTRLLFMWRGSLYKLIYRELLLFVVAFGFLSATYRNLFSEAQKRLFEKVVVYCDTFIAFIPLSFVLGFYVAYVAGRWWQQYIAIPWPDKVMHSLALYVGGNDVHGRMIRRTLMRYLNVSLILVLRSISSAVKRRFPTLDHLVEAGFMTSLELEMFQAVPNLEFNTYWIPCTWFIALLKDTKKSNRIVDSQGLQTIVQEFNEFRSKCGLLWSYDWISIPLVYTQVVTLATYSFFLAALVGRQYVEQTTSPQKRQFQMEIDIYIPLFTILQFFFYMGLLKVAEQLINPFGDDDEDFELNWLIDRHTKVSYLGVDSLMLSYPPLVKDKYFDDINLILPYTGAAFAYKKKTYRGSVHNMQVPEDQQSMFLPEISEEDEEDPDSCKRGSIPKKTSSFNNLMNAANPSTGTWRFYGEKASQSNKENLEATVQQAELSSYSNLDKFHAKAPWKSQCRFVKQPSTAPVFKLLEHNQWSSQSTLDSVDSSPLNNCSPGTTSTNPFDESFRKAKNINNKVGLKKVYSTEDIMLKSLSRSSIQSNTPSACKNSLKTFKFGSTGNIVSPLRHSCSKHLTNSKGDKQSAVKKLLSRRQSSSSGQWKGVRWKPVIDSSTPDASCDNIIKQQSCNLCQKCRRQSSVLITVQERHVNDSNDSSSTTFQSLGSAEHTEIDHVFIKRDRTLKKPFSKSCINFSADNVWPNADTFIEAYSLPNLNLYSTSTTNSNQTLV